MSMKKCTQCLIQKEETEFHNKKRKNKMALSAKCKKCVNIAHKEYRENNRDKMLNLQKRWHIKNRKKRREDGIQYRKDNPNAQYKSLLKRCYNITIEKYNEMFKKQNGICAICQQPETNGNRLSVDHNHNNNKVRGLLCNACNRGLGLFRDNADSLYNAHIYIKQSLD